MSNKTWPESAQGGVARPNRFWLVILIAFAAAMGFVLSARETRQATHEEPQPVASVHTSEQPVADTPPPASEPSDKLRGHTSEPTPMPTEPSSKP